MGRREGEGGGGMVEWLVEDWKVASTVGLVASDEADEEEAEEEANRLAGVGRGSAGLIAAALVLTTATRHG